MPFIKMIECGQALSRGTCHGCTFLALLVSLIWLAPSTLADQALLVYEDGRIEAQQEHRSLSAEKMRSLRHAWIWTNRSAPHRVEPQDFNDPATVESSELRIEFGWTGESPPAGLRLHAGPVKMWVDVPEAFLPIWSVPKNGRLTIPRISGEAWRLRLVGENLGSWWADIQPDRKKIFINVLPATEGTLVLLDEKGEPLPEANLNLMKNAIGFDAKPSILARYRSDGKGRVYFQGLPDAEVFLLYAYTDEHAPRVVSTRISTLPSELRLERGGVLRGRFVDGDGAPLAEVQVRAEAWLSKGVAGSIVRRAASDAKGGWRVDRLPRGKVSLVALREDLAPLQQLVQMEESDLDMGKLVLVSGTSISVSVTDDEGFPVVGAVLAASPGIKTSTNGKGLAYVRPPSGERPLKIKVHAEGYLPAEKILSRRYPAAVRFELRRSFHVEGRLVDEQHRPLGESTVRIRTGTTYRDVKTSFDGRFDLDLVPETPVQLTFRSAVTEELSVDLEAGAQGGTHDLGDLVLSSGLRVSGEILRSDGQPVSGARIWCPRPSPQGDVVAWAQGDFVEATSNIDGVFEVLGLAARPALLRIDAPGLARAHITIDPQPGASHVDAGVVVMREGVSVEILTDESADGAQARVDLRNLWQEPDMLTATVFGGRALLENVPPGEVTITVLKQQEILCEDTLDLAEDEFQVSVECQSSTMRVTGSINIAGQRAGAGALLWMPHQVAAAPSVILNFETRSGLSQQQVFGGGRPDVRVAVDSSGAFATNNLRAGAWEVSWLPAGGRSLAEAQRLVLPQLEAYEVHLEFSQFSVPGIVIDREGQLIGKARVRDVLSGAESMTSPDGRFVLVGLKPGLHQIHARWRGLTSEIVDVHLATDKEPEEISLVVDDRRQERIEITAVAIDGTALAGAFVFLESDNQRFQILTTNREGKSSIKLMPPYPQRIRAAMLSGGHWALGKWLDLDSAREGMTCYAPEGTGTVVMVSGERAVPEIIADSGWNMSELFASIGMRLTLSPDLPLEIHGLSPGKYHASIGGVVSSFVIHEADVTEIDIR